MASRQDLFPIEQGYFACIRFDEKWDRHEGHPYPSATDSHVRTVMHMVVDHVLKMEDQDKKEVRMTLEEEVIKSDLKVCFDCMHVFVRMTCNYFIIRMPLSNTTKCAVYATV